MDYACTHPYLSENLDGLADVYGHNDLQQTVHNLSSLRIINTRMSALIYRLKAQSQINIRSQKIRMKYWRKCNKCLQNHCDGVWWNGVGGRE